MEEVYENLLKTMLAAKKMAGGGFHGIRLESTTREV